MFYFLPILLFCFLIHCSEDDFAFVILPADTTCEIIDFVASKKKQIVLSDGSRKRESVSLGDILELRTLSRHSNYVFDQAFLLFFDDLFHFRNKTSVSNGTMLNQVGNIVKIIHYCTIPKGFTFIEGLRENISRLNQNTKKLFLPKKMGFLHIENKNEVEFLTTVSTENADYLFFQKSDQDQIETYFWKNLKLLSNEKAKHAFFLSHPSGSSQFLSFLQLAYDCNYFNKKHMRIPDDIFDSENNNICIFLYEDGQFKKNDNTVNFLSLYLFLKQEKEPQYQDKSKEFSKRVIQQSRTQLQYFFRKFKTEYNNAKNVVDLNFIQGNICSLKMFQDI